MPLNELREIWEETSDQLDTYQIPANFLKEQLEWRNTTKTNKYSANFDYQMDIPLQRFSSIFL